MGNGNKGENHLEEIERRLKILISSWGESYDFLIYSKIQNYCTKCAFWREKLVVNDFFSSSGFPPASIFESLRKKLYEDDSLKFYFLNDHEWQAVPQVIFLTNFIVFDQNMNLHFGF